MKSEYIPHPQIDFFKSNHRPYYISTGEYVQQSMGFKVPFHLCHVLNELGYEAYVTAGKPAPNLRTPLLNPDIIARHKAQGRETVAVYTEAMWGNVLQGDIVVRWMLNKIGKEVNLIDYPTDIFYYWDIAYSNADDSALLFLPHTDLAIYNAEGVDDSSREGFAYYAHKYVIYSGHKIPEAVRSNGISLCQDENLSSIEIADILKSVKFLICFEESALLSEASNCGCYTILIISECTEHLINSSNYISDFLLAEESISNDEVNKLLTRPLPQSLNSKKSDDVRQNPIGLADFITITQLKDYTTDVSDSLHSYCCNYSEVYIYGAGRTADVVFNALRAMGLNVAGFIISDEPDYQNDEKKHGLPVKRLSWFTKEPKQKAGLVLAMIKKYTQPIKEKLDAMKINYFDAVDY